MFYLQRTEGSLKRNVKRIPCVINLWKRSAGRQARGRGGVPPSWLERQSSALGLKDVASEDAPDLVEGVRRTLCGF